MIKSMTGFGKATMSDKNVTINVEIKSLNHRYFEVNSRVPRGYNFLEPKIKSYLNQNLKRGKIDVYISINKENSATKIEANMNVIDQYIDVLNQINNKYNLNSDLSSYEIINLPDTLSVTNEEIDDSESWNELLPVLNEAVNNLLQMRTQEGKAIKEDLENRENIILQKVQQIEVLSPQSVKEYENNLRLKLNEALKEENIQVDEARIITEVAIFADKIAVAEETVRLRSHFSQMNMLLNLDEPIGRRLDFLVQEMNREINTIGSKCSNIEISHIVVEVKGEIEKIREQLQNIE